MYARKISVVTFSILRTCFLQAFIHDPDFTYHHGVLILTSILEVNFGVACACLPLLQPFLKRHVPSLAVKISDNARDNERDNRRRNKRALERGGLGGELSVVTIGARFSPRRWVKGAWAGDSGRGRYHSIAKNGDTNDSALSADTGGSLKAVVFGHEDATGNRRIEDGRGVSLPPNPTLVIKGE